MAKQDPMSLWNDPVFRKKVTEECDSLTNELDIIRPGDRVPGLRLLSTAFLVGSPHTKPPRTFFLEDGSPINESEPQGKKHKNRIGFVILLKEGVPVFFVGDRHLKVDEFYRLKNGVEYAVYEGDLLTCGNYLANLPDERKTVSLWYICERFVIPEEYYEII